MFTGDRDGPLRRGNFHRSTAWTRTVVAAGLPSGIHLHDRAIAQRFNDLVQRDEDSAYDDDG